jgi:hypothetical protein
MTRTPTLPKGFKLPTEPGADARDAMLQMADAFGETDMFAFLGMMHGNDSPVGDVRAILGGRAVLDILVRQPELTYQQARITAGKKFGYEGNTLSNWNKIADRGRDTLIAAGQWPVKQGTPDDDTPIGRNPTRGTGRRSK